MSDGSDTTENLGESAEAAQAAEIVGDLVGIWLGALRLGYDRAKDPEADWSSTAVVQDAALVLHSLMPVLERSVNVSLAYLQPWSRAFTDRTTGGG